MGKAIYTATAAAVLLASSSAIAQARTELIIGADAGVIGNRYAALGLIFSGASSLPLSGAFPTDTGIGVETGSFTITFSATTTYLSYRQYGYGGVSNANTYSDGATPIVLSGTPIHSVTFIADPGFFNDFVFDAQPSFSSAAPEPATWAMMILGFGLAGFGLRRRRYPVGYA